MTSCGLELIIICIEMNETNKTQPYYLLLIFKAIKLTLLEEEEEEEDVFVDVPFFVFEFTAASNFDSKFMSIYEK